MLEEIIGMLFGMLSSSNMIIVLAVFVIFVVIAFKVFKTLVKGIMVAAVAATFPFIAVYFSIPLPSVFAAMSILERVIFFGALGLALFMIYSTISGGVTIVKIVTWPFRKLFGGSPKKEKIIIREKKKDD